MAGCSNTGVVNHISNPVASFPANSITVDIFGNTFYRNYSFGAGDDTGVYWNEAHEYGREHMLFIGTAIERALCGKFSFSNKLRSSQSHDFTISLPVTSFGEIDFDFMESFIRELEKGRIRELEEERVRELDAYLKSSGLADCVLSDCERAAIENFGVLKWRKYSIRKLFGASTRGKRLKSDDRLPGKLPFVTAGEAEEGVSALIGNTVEVFAANTVTIDMFGSAKYRNYAYGADDHVAVVHTEKLPKPAAVFVTSACNKAAHTGAFDYGRNFYAKDADALDIMLPAASDGTPDYVFMEIFIRAVQKLVIQEVADFASDRIDATRRVVGAFHNSTSM